MIAANRRRQRRRLTPLLLLVALLPACAGRQPLHSTNIPAPGRLHALLINGGGSPPGNYRSHAIHIEQMLRLLGAVGVPDSEIAVFNSDGSDPAPDQAVREESELPDRWRVAGTRLERSLISPVRYVNTEYPGVHLRPATRAALGEWFAQEGTRLQAGDTLLLYVTDHGNLNPKDSRNNTITLWGANETLSVQELTTLLASLDPDVHVVTLMSQCFSGSFAGIVEAHGQDQRPSGNICGFFSSTADRPAYGCYPENRGRQNVGHSFRFLQALAETGSFPASHERLLVDDDTPDVPLRTSDLFLATVLTRAAEREGQPLEKLVDELLQEAWRSKADWEPEIRLLDRIGQTYGYFSPRSLSEIAGPDNSLPDVAGQMRNLSDAWRGTLGDANAAELDKFLAADPLWVNRLNASTLDKATEHERETTASTLLPELTTFTARTPVVDQRLNLLHDHSVASAATSYRMSVRLGIVERMRYVLLSVAGRVYLNRHPDLPAAADYAALRQCEDLRLPPQPTLGGALEHPQPFPRMEDDVREGTTALPAWMGIRFQNVREEMQTRLKLTKGAASVISVFPNAPAGKAGLEVGDIVLGPPGKPFTAAGEVRWWTMLSPIGKPRELEILREGQRKTVTLRPAEFPLKWPELPGPPKVGSTAPEIKAAAYRGTLPELKGHGPHLLFFWATWCAPCKAALPEVMAFEEKTGTPVIAITDEPRETLDHFFATNPAFPQLVASDEYRKTFLAYGVSGTPTFVLVDDEGLVRSYATGYREDAGLRVEGWKMEATPTPSPAGAP